MIDREAYKKKLSEQSNHSLSEFEYDGITYAMEQDKGQYKFCIRWGDEISESSVPDAAFIGLFNETEIFIP